MAGLLRKPAYAVKLDVGLCDRQTQLASVAARIQKAGGYFGAADTHEAANIAAGPDISRGAVHYVHQE